MSSRLWNVQRHEAVREKTDLALEDVVIAQSNLAKIQTQMTVNLQTSFRDELKKSSEDVCSQI